MRPDKHLADLHPLGQLFELAGADHEGHLVKAFLEFILCGIGLFLGPLLPIVAVFRSINVVVVNLRDEWEGIRVLKVEQQLDRPHATIHLNRLATNYGRKRREPLLAIQKKLSLGIGVGLLLDRK